MAPVASPPTMNPEPVRRLGPHSLLGRLFWLVLLLGGLALYGQDVVRVTLFPNRQHVFDYYQEWSSARSWWLGEPVYQLTRETRLRDFPGTDPRSPWLLGYNVHPPTSVLVTLPLGRLNYFDSLIVWNALCLLAFFWAWCVIARNPVAPWSFWTWCVLGALLLWGSPFWQQIRLGQLNPILLLCLAKGWQATQRRHAVRAGFWLGWAAAIKLFPAFVGLYFLFRRDWKMLFWCIAWGLVITALTVGVLGLQTFEDYVTQVMPEAVEWRSSRSNASFSGLCFKLFDPGPRGGKIQPLLHNPLWARVAIGMGGLVVLGALWRACRRTLPDSHQRQNLGFGLTLIAMLLLSPVTWEHYFLLLPGACAAIWNELPRSTLLAVWYWFAVGLLSAPVYFLVERYLSAAEAGAGLTPTQVLVIPSLGCYGLLSLFGLGVIGARYSVLRSRLAS